MVVHDRVWRAFGDNEVSHSAAHYLLAVAAFGKSGRDPRAVDVARLLDVSRAAVSLQIRALRDNGLVDVADDFERALDRLTGALGDPTRRAIYLTVRESEEPITAARIAELFSIHSNVARHHLDRLIVDGYLRVADRVEGRPSAVGRPPRAFEATDSDIAVAYPARRHDLLAELLVRVVERVAPEEGPRIAEEVGRAYGEELAAAIGLPSEAGFAPALAAVARALTGAGFEVTADADAGHLVAGACPFGRTAADHPEVVCRLDLGIVKGLMAAAGGPAERVVIAPRRRPARPCTTA